MRGTFHVLQATPGGPRVARFVFPSSDAVYEKYVAGAAEPDRPGQQPPDGKGLYALTKILGEEMCWSYLRSYDIGTVLRFPIARVASELPDFYELWLDGLLSYKRGQQRRDPGGAGGGDPGALQRQAGDVRHLVVARDEYGQPYQRVYVDVRDVVQAIMLALEQEAAVGQAFPSGARTSRSPRTASLPVPKLGALLRCEPAGDSDLLRPRHPQDGGAAGLPPQATSSP